MVDQQACGICGSFLEPGMAYGIKQDMCNSCYGILSADRDQDPFGFYAVEMDDVLSEQIRVHNLLFKISIRNIIPIPWVFKPIDFEGPQKDLNSLNAAMWNILAATQKLLEEGQTVSGRTFREEELIFGEVFLEYGKSLRNSILMLENLCVELHLKSQNSNKLSRSEYNELLSSYKENERQRLTLGPKLNEVWDKVK